MIRREEINKQIYINRGLKKGIQNNQEIIIALLLDIRDIMVHPEQKNFFEEVKVKYHYSQEVCKNCGLPNYLCVCQEIQNEGEEDLSVNKESNVTEHKES